MVSIDHEISIIDQNALVRETTAMRRMVRWGSVVAFALSVLACRSDQSLQEKAMQHPPTLISHRGYAGSAPENTLVGVIAALEAGATHIEVDVQMTADGSIVLMHDRSVRRTTAGRGRVSQMTAAQISRLDAGAWYGEQFVGEPVPTLERVLEEVVAAGATLVIEVKHPSPRADLAGALAEVIKRRGAEGNVIVVSFDRQWLQTLTEHDPAIHTGDLWLRPRVALPETHSTIVSVHWASLYLDPSAVRRLHARDLQVWAWTVNNPRIARRLTELGVDGIVTDQYELMRSLW